ncbi:MAG: TIGR03084 family metal-binding protein [Pseudomonadota bacterium]
MRQALDFGAESAALDALLRAMPAAFWDRPTGFKGWTPNQIVIHLHYWNRAQDSALTQPAAFEARVAKMVAAIAEGRARQAEAAEAAEAGERGQALRALWAGYAAEMAERWAAVDPKRRLPWVGPEMSSRSAMTARQMETWAHGLAIWDLLGRERTERDRLSNIVHLGVSTFAWSHKVQGLDLPQRMPYLRLTAPSGAIWRYGAADNPDRIEGRAADFAMVVTQTRNVADTELQTSGPVGASWMRTAQCFAGTRETPPAPGLRRRAEPSAETA